MSKEIEWKTWNASPVGPNGRNLMAEQMMREEVRFYSTMYTGNALVLAIKDEYGEVELYDCTVVRRATISRESQKEMHEQPKSPNHWREFADRLAEDFSYANM